MNQLILGPSGARGIVGDTLFPETVISLVRALINTIPMRKKLIVIGRDTRNTGPAFSAIAVSTLTLCGYDVIDLGVVPTPCVQYAVEFYRADGGLVISASHNPAEWNALKFISAAGTFLDEKTVARLIDNYTRRHYADWVPAAELGTEKTDSRWLDSYLGKILNIIDVPAIRRRRFRVLLDANGGAGADLGLRLLKELNCVVTGLGMAMDGKFLHPTEPTVEHLRGTAAKIRKGNFDIGFAQDPDADRLVIIAENGYQPPEDATLALCVRSVLSKARGRGTVVANLSTSYIVRDEANRYGRRLYCSKVGETFVVSMMKKTKALIGGEGNGGVIHPGVHYGRDSLVGMALLLDLLARDPGPLSNILGELADYRKFKHKIKMTGSGQFAALKKNLTLLPGEQCDTRDGLKIYTDRYWLHLRPSNTEPVIRLMAEARDENTLKINLKRFTKKV